MNSLVALGLLLACVGCGPADPAEGSGAPDGGVGNPLPAGLPCDVAQVIATHCTDCHSDPPSFGAPMALTSRAAFAIESVESGESVAALAMDRIHRSDHRRMPPASRPSLTETELSALTEWLAAGAPTFDGVCEGTGPANMCVGPECLPCEPTHTFRSEGDTADSPFVVPPGGNPYRCVAFPSPFSQESQATAWAPIIDDARVVHHWILYRTGSEPELGPDCQMPLDAVGLMGWAPGTTNTVLPEDVGLELSTTSGEWLILQMHYWNVAGHEDAADRSGVALCATNDRRPKTAAVVSLGTTAVGIAPRTRDVEITSSCPSTSTLLLSEPLNILSSSPHMHRLGTSITTDILPAGVDIGARELIRVAPWSFDDQRAHAIDGQQIRPGDAVRTTCTYDNVTDDWVFFGERSEDEMCFNFLLVYPIEAWPAGYGRTCFSAIGL